MLLDHPVLFKSLCYIDGRWTHSDDAASIAVVDPADQSTLGHVPMLTREQIGVAVDAEQGGTRVRAADDQVEARFEVVPAGHPDVDVGEPARQRAHRPGPPRQHGEAVQARDRCQGQESNASTTASSIVCFGPVNQFFAEACHQIVRTASVPIVRIGA